MKHKTEFEKTPEGGLIWQDRDSLKNYLYSLPAGNYYLLAVKVADKRTIEQNSLLWRTYQQIANFLTAQGIYKGHDLKPLTVTAEMVHEYSKQAPELAALLPKQFKLVMSEDGLTAIEATKGTTTKLSRSANEMQNFSDYYEAVCAYWQTEFPNLIID